MTVAAEHRIAKLLHALHCVNLRLLVADSTASELALLQQRDLCQDVQSSIVHRV
eukprot:CAMPEP_0119331696 /NCGR_PEP_ID=MMETSP1333-20130426/81172_1 /TAXON_ID=418940 /ORGANISM="Scyphosphaera apsteinii, Strain RCC1455" /LENGTH=53 /DNA_ID=CAMNT_0007341363 /DNA_START=241 /DNA_END=402 /DNA_ORIENTATION=+